MEKEEKFVLVDEELFEVSDEPIEIDVITFEYLLERGLAEVIGDTHGLMNTPSNRNLQWVKVDEGVMQVGNSKRLSHAARIAEGIADGDDHPGHTFTDFEELVEVFLPDSVRILEQGAFENCKVLETIVMSKNILFIGYRAFGNCENLKIIDLYPGIRYIDFQAFESCSSLKEVRFHGSFNEFQKIKIDRYAFDKGVTILCDDGKKIQF